MGENCGHGKEARCRRETAKKHQLDFQALKPVCIELGSTPIDKERTAKVKQRVNQRYFRNPLLNAYEGQCCVTGLSIPKLLVASRIKPWPQSDDATDKLDPSNGLLLNALHDQSFDQGLITVTQTIEFESPRRSATLKTRAIGSGLMTKAITLPKVHAPSKDLLQYHNDIVFRGWFASSN